MARLIEALAICFPGRLDILNALEFTGLALSHALIQ